MFGYNVANDLESEQFAMSAASNILTLGQQLSYQKEASPELLRHVPVTQIEALTLSVGARCGKAIPPFQAVGVTQNLVGSSDGVTKLAQYTVTAKLQHCVAMFLVQASKKGADWQLTGLRYRVDPS